MASLAPSFTIPRGSIKTQLDFYAPPADGSAPYDINGRVPEGEIQQNYENLPLEVTINDMRGSEAQFSLNRNGFVVLHNVDSTQDLDFDEPNDIEKRYFPEIESLLLRELPGAQRVAVYDYTIRRSGIASKRSPVRGAHIDQTHKAVQGRIHSVLGEEAEQLMQGRYRLITVWRPLKGPVLRDPLAMADSVSVADNDLVMVEHRYANRVGETYRMKPSTTAAWWYLSGMTVDERIMLQMFDSQDGARCAHAAFEHPETRDDWPGRESIEVRALVFG